jgi:5-methylcytosine-specific restriction protein A
MAIYRGHNLVREDILKIISEFDRVYPNTNDYDSWLDKDTYKIALYYNKKYYPARIILSQATGIRVIKFGGGIKAAKRLFSELGFQVVRKPTLLSEPNFEIGKSYKRTDLHDEYSGQGQGGISTPADHNFIMLFTGDSGEQYGYHDLWLNGIFHYTGEGQSGDMQFTRGNLAIRDHLSNGKTLHLFENLDSGYVSYVGQMVCTGYHHRDDIEHERQLIIFELALMNNAEEEFASSTEELSKKLSLSELRQKALMSSTSASTAFEHKTISRLRSQAIKLYARKRANGICEGCGQKAPFKDSKGEPFLEVHHVNRLADGGPDHPAAVVAICPNCHRHAHYSKNAEEFNSKLKQKAQQLEANG